MITIEYTDYGHRFLVRQKEPGFGRGSKAKVRDLESAFETVRHYFAQPHDKTKCGFCELDRAKGEA